MALAMVFAVYMPPQEPGPGMAHSSMSASVVSVILPLACWPTASKTVTMSTSFAVEAAGQDRAAIDEDARPVQPRHGHDAAGHVLVATADGHEAVEPLAADHGLDGVGDDFARTREYFMPSVPMEMPSEMVMVLKMRPCRRRRSRPSRLRARVCRCACCTA